MSKLLPSKDTIKRRTVKRMKELGVYKVQYTQLIDVFVDMLHQYNYLTNEFEESGYQVMIETEKSDGKKSPILATLETLRKDIGVYSDKLMLNPKTNVSGAKKGPSKQSTLAQFLNQSGSG
ncbi:P27 family phage terminase small subunit [Enterococcus sp. LJL90]